MDSYRSWGKNYRFRFYLESVWYSPEVRYHILHNKEPHRILDFHPNKPKNSSRQKNKESESSPKGGATPPLCVNNLPVTPKIIPAASQAGTVAILEKLGGQIPSNLSASSPAQPAPKKSRTASPSCVDDGGWGLDSRKKTPRNLLPSNPACYNSPPFEKGKGFLYIICWRKSSGSRLSSRMWTYTPLKLTGICQEAIPKGNGIVFENHPFSDASYC